jgi:hypothetical protein
VPGSDVVVAGVDRERHEGVAEEVRWRFADGSTAHMSSALRSKMRPLPSILSSKPSMALGEPVWDAVEPIADVVDGHNALSIARDPISAIGMSMAWSAL